MALSSLGEKKESKNRNVLSVLFGKKTSKKDKDKRTDKPKSPTSKVDVDDVGDDDDDPDVDAFRHQVCWLRFSTQSKESASK